MSAKPFAILAALLMCVACGDASGGVDPAEKAPDNVKREFTPINSSDSEVFARLAGTFATSQMLAGAKIYFTAPKPYGSWLCRVDSVYLPPWVVSGRPKTKDEFFKDDLEVTRHYAAWRSPKEKSEKDRYQACREFRNFDNTFYADDNGDPERYIFLLDQLLTHLSENQVRYSLNCKDLRDGNPNRQIACDPKELLKGVSIYSSFSGSTAAATEVGGGRIHRDTITFDRGYEHGHPVWLSIEFESFQTYGEQSSSEANINSVAIRMEVL